MSSTPLPPTVLVVPCSGIGKVQGLVSREAAYEVVDRRAPGRTATTCLALLTIGDAEALQRVRRQPCITVDGCPRLCAKKNVELCGGEVRRAVRVYDTLKRHRGAEFGSPTKLSEAGWLAVDEVAAEIAAELGSAAAGEEVA